MFGAVILDLDGLMLDTERIAAASWKRASAELGREVGDDVIAKMIGLNARDSDKVLRASVGASFPLDELKERRLRYTNEWILSRGIPPKEGLAELLTWLDKHGIPHAVATSTDRSRALWKLEQAQLGGRFAVIVTGDEVKNGKPAPDIFLLAARRLTVEPEECIVLEDSDAGARAAHAAGMKVIVVPDLKQPARDVFNVAVNIVPSLTQAIPIIADLMNRQERNQMTSKTIAEIETKLLNDEKIPEDKKRELLKLLSTLREEISSLAETHVDHAQSIAGFTEVTTHEATRGEKNPHLLRLAVEGLRQSVKEFEVTHPRLTQTVNEVSVVLSNMGI